MRRLSFLLRPGWIALVLAVIIFSGACFYILSPWQFGRNSERVQENDAITYALSTGSVPLAQLLPGGTEPTSMQTWREVTMTGHYLQSAETVARLREDNGGPADEILTPFELTNGRIELIDRGWVVPNNGNVPTYAPAPRGTFTIVTRVQQDEPDPHRAPLFEGGYHQVYAINTTVVSEVTGLHLNPGYFQLQDNQPGVLNVLPVPQLDSGPFLSYAWQWIAFGVMAIFGLGYFTWREIQPGGALTPEGRARRRVEKAEREEAKARVAGRPTAEAKPRRVRGRHVVAAMIAEEEARERAEAAAAAQTAAAGEADRSSEAGRESVSTGVGPTA